MASLPAVPSSVATITSAASALSGLLLVSPQNTVGYQPQPLANPDGSIPSPPKPLLFNYEGEQGAILTSDITDHFVEDNTAIQDQIALKPEEITTQGFIGELNDAVPAILQPLAIVATKLQTISGYTPVVSATAELAYNEAFELYQTVQSAVNSISSLSNLVGGGGENVIDGSGITSNASNQNKQQQFFDQFYGYWRNRTLFTIQTPWAVFTNMAIKSLHVVQDEQTQFISTFTVTFKMIRFAETLETTNLGQGRVVQQGASLENAGVQTPNPGPDVIQQMQSNGLAVA